MTDLLSPLRDADPARDDAPTPAEARRMDAILEAAMRAEPRPAAPAPAPGRGGPRARSRSRRRPVLALAGAGALAATAALAVTLVVPGDSSVAPQPASAAVVLGQLREAAAAAPEPTGRYAYWRGIDYRTHMRGVPNTKDTYAVVFPHEREEWIDDEGNGVMRDHALDKPSFPTPEDKAAYERYDTPLVQLPESDGMRVEGRRTAGLTAAQIRALPTTVPELRAAVLAGMRESGVKADNALVAGAAQLIASPLTPKPVRAALFGVLRAEPGAVAAEGVRDPLGRVGTGITYTTDAWRTTILADVETGDVLGIRSVGLKELDGREMTDWSLVLETGRRDTAPDAPTEEELQRRGPQPVTPVVPEPPRRR